MQKHTLADRLAVYVERPEDLLVLLATESDRSELFEEIKLFIQAALSRNEIVQAEQAEQLAWRIAHHTADQEEYALAHWCSLSFFAGRDIKQALYHADEARKYYVQTRQTEKEGRILIGYASQLNLLGRIEEAAAAIHRSILCLAARPDYRDWPMIYINLSYIQIQQGHYSDALTNAQQAVTLAITFGEQKGDPTLRYQWMRAQALVNEGLAALFLGHYEEAEQVVKLAQTLAQSYGFANVAGRADLNLARIALIKGELLTALQVLRTARQNLEPSTTTTQRTPYTIEEAYLYIEEAHLYQRLAMVRRASRAAARAATAFAENSLPAGQVEATLLAVRLSITLHEPSKAHAYLIAAKAQVAMSPPVHQALWAAYAAHSIFQKKVAERQNALQAADHAAAALQHSAARSEWLEAALIAAQLAIDLRLPDAKPRLQAIVDLARQYGLNAIEQEACLKLAQTQSATLAIPILRRAADILQQIRLQMPVEELKATLLTGQHRLYTQLIEAQLKNRQPLAAIATLLEAKGGLWLDLTAPAFPVASQSAWAEWIFWRDELRAANEAEYRTLCQAKMQTAEQAIAEGAREPPSKRAAQPTPTITDLQATLDRETVIFEYLIGATHIWACIVGAVGAVRWVRLCEQTELQPVVERFTLLLATLQHCATVEQRYTTATAQQLWMNALQQQLYQMLLAPLTADLPASGKIVIVPDGSLFEIPWMALTDGQAAFSERYCLTLAPSAALLAGQRSSAPTAAPVYSTPRALGYAGHPPLPFIATELLAIQQAWPDVLVANPATAADLRWDTPPRFLHISTHGRVQRNAPLLSSLTLADGPFLLADAFKLRLQGTQFVALSACETGIMPEQGGVLLALAGAFLCAGTQTVLASLWAVDDEATQILMSTFYRALQNNNMPVQALQQAQQAVRAAGYWHPFYWAAFQLLSRVL